LHKLIEASLVKISEPAFALSGALLVTVISSYAEQAPRETVHLKVLSP